MKFVIISPRQRSGGSIVLHRLCQCLNEVGYDARILYAHAVNIEGQSKEFFWTKWICRTMEDFILSVLYTLLQNTPLGRSVIFKYYQYAPIKNCPKKHLPIIGEDTVLVYPDVFYGNIFNAKNVVRWFLYYNRFGKEAYGKEDLFYTYRDVFIDKTLNPENRKLYLAYFDLDLYKKTNFGYRSGKCYIVRKGKNRTDLPKSFDGLVLDDLQEKEKVKVMNECEYCISYDTQTSYTAIAAICGCISIIIPEPGKTWDDYRGKGENHYGEALGFDRNEIEYAKKTAPKVIERYQNLNAAGVRAAEKFAEECKSYFGM